MTEASARCAFPVYDAVTVSRGRGAVAKGRDPVVAAEVRCEVDRLGVLGAARRSDQAAVAVTLQRLLAQPDPPGRLRSEASDLCVLAGLAYRRRSLIGEPYRERRRILERIDFHGRAQVPEAFGDGEALFDAVRDQELEGVVAKRLNERYRPGERAWVKTKNREYSRWEIEHEGALRVRRPRRFV